MFLANPSLHCQFFPHCLFGGWSQALSPSCSFCDPLVLWRNNSGLPLLQLSSLYLSHDSILCILQFILSYLWETVKASVIFLSCLKQHSDAEAILYHSRWLTVEKESCEENLMTLFARLQEAGTLAISSGLLHICGSSYPLGMGIYLPRWLTELFSFWLALCISTLDKMPQCSKNVQFSDTLYLAQTLYFLLRFPPHLFQLSTHDWTMRGHWQWPEGCWLQGQHHLLDPTSPPVHVELFGTFKFYRGNTGHDAPGKPWGHI